MANLPRRGNLERTIRQHRNDRHQSPNPEIRAEIPVLPLEYQLSENAEQFLPFDSLTFFLHLCSSKYMRTGTESCCC